MGETTSGAKRLVGAKRLGGKRPGGKRLGGETTRGEMVWGRNDPDSNRPKAESALGPSAETNRILRADIASVVEIWAGVV